MASRNRRQRAASRTGSNDSPAIVVSSSEDEDYVPTELSQPIDDDELSDENGSTEQNSVVEVSEGSEVSPEVTLTAVPATSTGRARPRARKKAEKKKPVWDWEAEREHWQEANLEGYYDANGELDMDRLVKKKLVESYPQPPEIKMPLLPFQLESLAWMIKQERNEKYRGGILADEMGMGKTIQTISLIVARKMEKLAEEERAALPKDIAKTTIIICPLVAVRQWKNEIEQNTEPGTLSVYVYHGSNRTTDLEELGQYDVVITTYSIIEIEYRQRMGFQKIECEYCGRRFYIEKLKVHNMYFCGPDAQKTAKQALQERSRPTAGPSSRGGRRNGYTDAQDDGSDDDSDYNGGMPTKGGKGKRKRPLTGKASAKEPPEKKSSKRLALSRKASSSSKKKKEEEEDEDTEGPSFGRRKWAEEIGRARKSLKAHFDELQEANSDKSPLHSKRWFRIVLDEAHYIKDRSNSTSKSVFAMKSQFRWALSGTPLQNRVSELHALVRFLEVYPFSYYFNRSGTCSSLSWDFDIDTKKCIKCGQHRMSHFSWWNKVIMNPIQRRGFDGEGRSAMLCLKHGVLDNILLRRTKKERAADIVLPPKVVRIRKDVFDEKEDDFYMAMYTQSQAKFATYVQSGTVLNNYAHIFDLLTRLRQAVNHPYLVAHSKKSFEEKNSTICGICKEEAEDCIETACGHRFDRECMREYLGQYAGDGAPVCPTCENPLTVDLNAPAVVTDEKMKSKKTPDILRRIKNVDDFQSSTKIEALLEELQWMRENDSSAKAIIFSQFVSMLDLIEYRLKLAGIASVKLVGSQSLEARNKYIESFVDNPDVTIFLISLKAGGLALNLTVASHVFLMDPWWNPAAESQAIDRIHRLGQFKPIRATRFTIGETIEDRILRLQEKKQLVFESTIGQSREALNRLTVADMQFLFQ